MVRSEQRPVLLVEDEPLVLEIVADFLQDEGYPVIKAADGREALQLLNQHPAVELIVTDIDMPGMNGVELADEACRQRPGLRVIFTSGRYKPKEIGLAGRQFLQKPYSSEQLVAAVKLLAG